MRNNVIIQELYFGTRFYWFGLMAGGVFVLVWMLEWPIEIAQVFFLLWLALSLTDLVYLFLPRHRFTCTRSIAARISNSDYNPVKLMLWHSYPLPVRIRLIEEFPEQLQARDNTYRGKFAPYKKHDVQYMLRPVNRGDYQFGHTICIIGSQLGLIKRRRKGSEPQLVKVYPSFLQLRQFQLLAQTAQVQEQGTRQLRKIGHSLEFDHIKAYVRGDDVRAVNWKATARRADLMVNSYVDERSQQVYCVIDKGRLMKMPFKGLSLMDYAINSTLVMASVALHRQDRFGLITFSHRSGEYVNADKKPGQLKIVQEALYRINTEFFESDYEKLYLQLRTQVKQRSMIVLFTNFESAAGMRRQLPYLRLIARHHLLLVVFFENTELAQLADTPAGNLNELYTNTIAGKFVFDKKMMVRELTKHGIMSLLTPPEELTIQTVNKYVELKTRQAV